MAPANGKRVICFDCPLSDANDGDISRVMSDRRNETDGLYSQLEKKGYCVVRLPPNPCLDDLENELKKSDPPVAFLTASGHGTEGVKSFLRVWDEDLLVSGGLYSRKAFGGKILHLFACATAENLGPDMVGFDIHDGPGLSAFIGYNADFIFPPDYAHDQRAAEMLIDCDSAIDLALADGKTPEEALHEAANAFTELMNEWRADHRHGTLVNLVQQDLDALCLLPGPYKFK